MDNEDAIEIKNSIETITLNNKQLIQSRNEQVVINGEIIVDLITLIVNRK